MLHIETDGTVTHRGARIGTVILDNPARDTPKIGGLLRECPREKIEELEGHLAADWHGEAFGPDSDAEDAIDKITLILDGDLDDKAMIAAIP